MKSYRLTILAIAVLVSAAVHGQLFVPLGLGIETSSEMVVDFQPQMYVEGDFIYVCTKQGLYSKDLSNNGSEWQLVGFEGIPILDYVRRGDDIYALCFNDKNDVFLLSHDGGKTFEDVTPDDLRYFIDKYGHVFWYFSRHPNDPNTFLLSSFQAAGILLTTDFGQTWQKISPYTPDYTGFHTLKPEIIYECGGRTRDWDSDLHISYDFGQTWQNKSTCLPNTQIFRMAFHPTDPDRWIAGGGRSVHTTNDNGQTWNTQYFSDDYERQAIWHYAEYDNENADIIYMAGSRLRGRMNLMCSTDGGSTWNTPYLELTNTSNIEYVFDMKQYCDKLLIYSQSDVYMVSKADLIEQTTSIKEVKSEKYNDAIYDLSGRKVNCHLSPVNSQLKKGVYIQNGKKIIVK